MTDKDKCKGLFYRYYENIYIDKSGSLIQKKSLKPLKRMSCKGCSECEWIKEILAEDIANDLNPAKTSKGFVNYGIYQLIVHVGHDFETGYVDDIVFEFLHYKEEEQTDD